MDWFKRYGIPGACSMGLTFVWLLVLYPCRIDLQDEKTLKIMGGIFAGGFLPFGYLICMIGHGWYFLCCSCSSKCGRHARARHIVEADRVNEKTHTLFWGINEWAEWAVSGKGTNLEFHPDKSFLKKIVIPINCIYKKLLGHLTEKSETVLAACSVLEAITGGRWSEQKERFAQEWIRKRTDIVVMNQAIMTGTIVCTIGALCLGLFLSDWSMQPREHRYWIWFLIMGICLHLIIWYVTVIFRIKIDIVIAGVFKLRK